MENEKTTVNTSDFTISTAPKILITQGIGSCIAICLYDKDSKTGALLHIMLPNAGEEKLNPMRFADTALSLVMNELEKKNIPKEKLIAKLVGGAHMFKAYDLSHDIGTKNTIEVKKLLKERGIPIEGEDLGGDRGRSIEFDLSTGQVKIAIT